MANQLQQANMFELSGDDIQITYSATSFQGVPLFSYRDSDTICQFNGNEIHSIDTEFGELLTVILAQIPDLRTVTFTLILPVVNLLPGSGGTHIQVPGITTRSYTSIAGPIVGPAKKYSLVNLKGTAQVVAP